MSLQGTKTDDAGCESEGGFVHEGGALETQAQTAKALELGEGAFHHPAVHTQPAAVFLAAFGQNGTMPRCHNASRKGWLS